MSPGRKPGSRNNALRELARLHEGSAFDLIRRTLSDESAPLHLRVGCAETVLAYSRGRPSTAAQISEPIPGGVDVTSEPSAVASLQRVVDLAARGEVPVDQAQRFAGLIATAISAEQGRMSSRVEAAMAEVQAVLEADRVRRIEPPIVDRVASGDDRADDRGAEWSLYG